MALTAGCGHKEDNTLHDAAHELYGKSLEAMLAYTDSMKSARDSARVHALSRGLEERLTHINFEYPTDAYLEISEGQNDTLTNLTFEFTHLRDSLLYRFANPIILLPDSLNGEAVPDSIGSIVTAEAGTEASAAVSTLP